MAIGINKYYCAVYAVLLLIIPFTPEAPCREETWMEIYSGESKVGHSYREVTKKNGLTYSREETSLKLVLLGTETEMNIASDYILEGQRIRSFDYKVTSDSVSLRLEGKLEGNKLTISEKENQGAHVYVLNHEYILPSLLPDYLSIKGLKEGASYKVYLFDPVNIYTGYDPDLLEAEVKVLGLEDVETKAGAFAAYKVTVNFLGAEHLFWISQAGKSVMEKFEPSLTSVLSSKQHALKNANIAFDITEKTSIASNRYIHNPRDVKNMVMVIRGIDNFEGLRLDDGYSQSFKNGTLRISSPDLTGSESLSLSDDVSSFKDYLESTRLIQKDDPEIIKQAKKIVDNENNPYLAVKLINEWTYENIEKIPTVSIPSAVDVLKSRKGDCNEHAVIFAALTRSVGIPVKVVLGVVYLEGRFYYHAWNEVYIGKWVPVDSTFGQIPADATHLKLIEGDISKSPEILKVVGKIQLEVVEAK